MLRSKTAAASEVRCEKEALAEDGSYPTRWCCTVWLRHWCFQQGSHCLCQVCELRAGNFRLVLSPRCPSLLWGGCARDRTLWHWLWSSEILETQTEKLIHFFSILFIFKPLHLWVSRGSSKRQEDPKYPTVYSNLRIVVPDPTHHKYFGIITSETESQNCPAASQNTLETSFTTTSVFRLNSCGLSKYVYGQQQGRTLEKNWVRSRVNYLLRVIWLQRVRNETHNSRRYVTHSSHRCVTVAINSPALQDLLLGNARVTPNAKSKLSRRSDRPERVAGAIEKAYSVSGLNPVSNPYCLSLDDESPTRTSTKWFNL